MNTISWLIYGAEALSDLGQLVGFSIFVGLLMCLAVNVSRYLDCEYTEEKFVLYTKPLYWILGLSVLIVLLPSTQTIYLIASSELGETLITKPETQEIMQDVYEILRGKLGELKGDLG